MDKIEEVKKLLWILDSKHNVSIPQTKENIDFIAGEIVKLFCQPAVVRQSEQCSGCEESTGETKIWCCNHCGKRIEVF